MAFARSVVIRHLNERNLRTLANAVARYGLRHLASRVVAELRAGGPALLLHKFRLQRALLAPPGSSGKPVHRPMLRDNGPNPVFARSADGLELDANYCLPAAQFTRFMNLWHRHPAIASLTEGCAPRKFGYTIVVSPHPEHGFDKLPDTLNLAHNLTLRAGLSIGVVVIAPGGLSSLVSGVGQAPVVVQNVAELRERLASGQDANHMVQFLVSGDGICPVYAEVLGRSKVPDFDLVLTDMYIQESERDVYLVLLPGINPIHAFNVDYFHSRAILRPGLATELLAGLATFDAYALVVRALERCAAQGESSRAHHIAFPMLCIAETRDSLEKRRLEALARALPLRLSGAPATVPPAVPSPQRRVSVVICTKDNGFLLEQLVESLWQGHERELADIVVVANRTTNAYAVAVHQRLAAAGRIRCVNYDAPFSFAAQSNLGAAASGGDILLFLNDDVVPVNRGWLRELVAPLDDPRIGIVGPLLLYPDQGVQHAGMYLGFNGLAGHALRGAKLPRGDYGFLASAPREVMAVTGAALSMRRADFDRLNGFDQNLFALYIQDVDLCLRAHFSGLAVVYNPRAILLHMESTSVKATLVDPWMTRRRALEHEAFVRRWGDALANDPFHNPNFARRAESLRSLEFPPP